MSQKTFEITSGPSREELFDGLRLSAERRLVCFEIANNGKKMSSNLLMRGIEVEDGSGESWIISISIEVKALLSLNMPVDYKNAITGKWIALKAYYSTHTRKGSITINNE